MTQPNILFIVADQHNAKALGHKGHPDAKTPHLDRMAREGCRFENAITQNPICTPSRVSFLSGVNSARFDTPELNRQRVQRYQTVANRDGKINPELLRGAKNKNYL